MEIRVPAWVDDEQDAKLVQAATLVANDLDFDTKEGLYLQFQVLYADGNLGDYFHIDLDTLRNIVNAFASLEAQKGDKPPF